LVGGQPVFVDFETSIAERDTLLGNEAASLVEGRRTRRSAIKKILFGSNPVEIGNARHLVKLVHQGANGRTPIVLVVGGGTMSEGVRALHQAEDLRIIAFDIYASANTDFVADAHSIPLRDEVIDAVWIQAVLEHVLSPHQVAEEIGRVLRPGGLLYAETPFLQPVHEGAYDFTRFTESGHRWLFRRFETIDSGVVSGPGTTLFQMLRYVAGALLRNRKLGSLAALPFFWLRFFDRLVPRAHASDLASGVYFLGRKAEKPIAASDMPGFFKGVA
jgi:SAM-dependent methyltransferase